MELNEVASNLINNITGENVGIGGFDLYVWQEQRVTRQAKVTELVLEDGSVASDHIALAPVTLNIGGVVTDAFLQGNVTGDALDNLFPSLGQVTGLLGVKGTAVINQIDSTVSQAKSYFDKGNSLYTNLMTGKGIGVGGLQQQFIDTFDAIFNDRKLITVDFGYQVYENMAIQSFETTMNNEVNAILFTMNLTQVNFVEFEQVEVTQPKENKGKKSPTAKKQSGKTTNKGKVPATKPKASGNKKNGNSSVLDGMFGGMVK